MDVTACMWALITVSFKDTDVTCSFYDQPANEEAKHFFTDFTGPTCLLGSGPQGLSDTKHLFFHNTYETQ